MIPPYKGAALAPEVNIELGNNAAYQLYDVKKDPSQKSNVASTQTKVLEEMRADFLKLRGKADENVGELELK